MEARKSTTLLPQSLADKIKGVDGQDDERFRRTKKRSVPRKDARKNEREAKKKRKGQNHALKNKPREPVMQSPLKRPAVSEPEVSRKKVKLQHDKVDPARYAHDSSATPSSVKPKKEPLVKSSSSAKTIVKRDATKRSTVTTAPPKTKKASAEDREIAWLEAQLGLSGSKKSGKSKYGAAFAEDGLDDLLMDVDRILESTSKRPEAEETVFDLDIEEEEDDEDEDEDNDDDDENGDEEEDEGEEDGSAENEAEIIPHSLNETRYVPPHLRPMAATTAGPSPELVKLTRSIKGLLNRMSEQNIETVLGEIQALYRTHPRNDVTTTLTTLVINGIASHSSHLDAFVVLHAALVSSLHKLIGIDFAAHFVQACIETYEGHYATLKSALVVPSSPAGSEQEEGSSNQAGKVEEPGKGKECTNLIVLISELYNFHVISCGLVYDVIRALLAPDDFLDGDGVGVELLLKITRNSGPQLRTDDPMALKDIVQIVQAKVANRNARALTSRVRFMVETLTNLKNNKINKTKAAPGNAGNAVGADSAERMRRFVTGLEKKHHVLAHEPLHVSLEDLHSSDKKGKWWLVGSAWAGDPLAERQNAKGSGPSVKRKETGKEKEIDVPLDAVLLKLARKQGMNTDVRRSIFVVLMSSDDYVDACERLGQLSLTELQQREIVRVIVHCCGNETSYNPYYTMVCQQLCRTSHSYAVTLQYCLWDFLRDLGETDVGGAAMVKDKDKDNFEGMANVSPAKINNVAMAYAWWIAKGCTTLLILKAVDLTNLQPQSQTFFKIFFAQLFISSQSTSPALSYIISTSASLDKSKKDRTALETIFLKMVRNVPLTQGVLHFISRAKLQDMASEKGVGNVIEWGVEVAKDSIRDGMESRAREVEL